MTDILTEILGFDPNAPKVSPILTETPEPIDLRLKDSKPKYWFARKIDARFGDYEVLRTGPRRWAVRCRSGIADTTTLKVFQSRTKAKSFARGEYVADYGTDGQLGDWEQSDFTSAKTTKTATKTATKTRRRCSATTKKGTRCKLNARKYELTCKRHGA